jgi:hypothetical protein
MYVHVHKAKHISSTHPYGTKIWQSIYHYTRSIAKTYTSRKNNWKNDCPDQAVSHHPVPMHTALAELQTFLLHQS